MSFKTNNVAKFRATHSFKAPISSGLNFMRASTVAEGVGILVEIIFLSVGMYVAAFIMPGALTAMATTALTSEPLIVRIIKAGNKLRDYNAVPNARTTNLGDSLDRFKDSIFTEDKFCYSSRLSGVRLLS